MTDSKDLQELRRLVFEDKWNLSNISLTINSEATGTATLTKGAERKTLTSSFADFCFFLASQRSLPDRDGKPRFFKVDTKQYEDDLLHFFDPDNAKLKAATQKVLAGQARINLPEATALLKRVFLDEKMAPEDIARLADCFYEIDGLYTARVKFTHDHARALEQKLPQAKALREEIDHVLLNTMLLQLEHNPLRGLKSFSSWIDLEAQDRRFNEQIRYHNWFFAMLAARGQTPGDEAISYLLDVYRRFSELARTYIQALLKATDTPSRPKPKGFAEEVDALADRGFPTLATMVDPRIRHSESHLNTRLLPGRMVRIVADAGQIEYSYEQILAMTRRLKDEVVPALFISFLGVESILFPCALKKPAIKLFLIKELQKQPRGVRSSR